jgi:hypothetical protein
MVLCVVVTDASVHDSQVFSQLMDIDGTEIWGDIAKHTKVDMIWVAGRSPTLVSHSEAWRSHES